MPRQPRDQLQAKLLVEFRRQRVQYGGRISYREAARNIPCDRETARRAYQGSIKALLDEEARTADAAAELRQKAVAAAGAAQTGLDIQEEIKSVRNVEVASNALWPVLRPAYLAAQQVTADLLAAVRDPASPMKKDAVAMMHLVRQFVAAVRSASEVSQRAQEMKHTLLGDPNERIKVEVEHQLADDQIDEAAVLAEAKALVEAMQRDPGAPQLQTSALPPKGALS